MMLTFTTQDEYRKHCEEENAIERMRREKRWNRTQFLDFLEAYIECALWTETPDGEPEWSRDDVWMDAYNAMYEDCLDFVQSNHGDLYELNPSQCGHDFWLSRNRHGAGFWDRGNGALGYRLHDAAKVYGEFYLYVGDDGRIHC